MPKCVPVEKLLNFATARLSPGEHQTVRDHVQDCPSCQTRLTHIKETVHFVVHYEPAVSARIPPRLHRQLLSMIPAPADQKTKRSLSDVPVPMQKIRRIVAQWIRPTVSHPLPARTQGAVETERRDHFIRTQTRLYRAEAIEIVLALKHRKGDQWAIVGEVISGEVSGEVILRALDGSVQQSVSAEESAFLFDTVERGTYVLQIPCGDRWIEIEALKVDRE